MALPHCVLNIVIMTVLLIIVTNFQDGMNIVDVLAIMPFFITLFMADPLDVET